MDSACFKHNHWVIAGYHSNMQHYCLHSLSDLWCLSLSFPVRPSSLSHPLTSAFVTCGCICTVPGVAYLLQPLSDTHVDWSLNICNLCGIFICPAIREVVMPSKPPMCTLYSHCTLRKNAGWPFQILFLLQGVLLTLVIPSLVLPLLGLPDPKRSHEHIWCQTNAQQRSSNNPA